MTNIHTITTERLRIRFAKDPFLIKEITNLSTGKVICRNGRQTLLVRTPLELFEPTVLTRVRSIKRKGDAVHFVLSDDSLQYVVNMTVGPSHKGLRFRFAAKAPKPIWLVEWRLSGLDLEGVIVPALGGQMITKAMPVETTLSYKYPFWWNAQFVIGTQRKGGVWIRSTDPGPHLKLLRVRKERSGFAITYGFEADAPLASKTFEGELFVDGFADTWRQPVEVHREWMESAFGLTLLDRNPAFPHWARQINFVLEMWGMTKDRPEPLHTFEQMINRLKAWKKLHDPRKTLVYLPGFAMHGIDSHAPDYYPSEPLGGEAGFRKLVREAHHLGYRVMVHTNVLAMTFTHRLYKQFKKHQVVDPFGRLQGWGLDMDGDWLAEPYFAYINPGAKEWGDLMERVIGELIASYGIDAVFLDQTLLAFNVSKGPNFLAGMRTHIDRLRNAFPGILFAGEGYHEQVAESLLMAQIHGIDSIAEVHALDGVAPWRVAHPVLTELFSPYTRFVAHLLTKHPSHPVFRLQEEAYAELGVVPALCLYHHEQAMDLPATRAMVRRANNLRRKEPA